MEQGEIVIYKTTDTNNFQLEVRVENETVWLTQAQMVELFNSTKQNISLHINNIFKEGELEANSTAKEYLTVQQEGKRKVKQFTKAHDRFLIIDNETVYHIGASLKDLGKKPVVSEVESMVCILKNKAGCQRISEKS